ncbi:YgjP-like metallopeptidase domain-containing protein [Mycoplasmopsis sturni]|uniref:YgjP-like metallopeptidase domain-containing protein n=1 Tax=Mycoplasmopsis sturni TaxID=39047 RepID=UPI00056BAABE|nr:YgjP-like metallopeptidase domain-containing protein [Mycoplasmopsis sturni]
MSDNNFEKDLEIIPNKELHINMQENTFYFLGEKMTFSISTNPFFSNLKITNSFTQKIIDVIAIKNKTNQKQIQKEIQKWIAKKFLPKIEAMQKEVSDFYKIPSSPIEIIFTKTILGRNWSKGKKIQYSSFLAAFCPEVVQSVVVHEVCHTVSNSIPSHGKEFYQCVYKKCPNYKALKKKIQNRNFY